MASKTVLDLGLAVFEKDVYINFSSNASSVTIILPEGVNATCDISRKIAGVKNLVDNVDEEGIHTVYIIGKAVCSNVEVIPVNFYVDEEDEEDPDFVDEDDCLASEDDFDDDVIFDEKDGDVEVEVKVINGKVSDNEQKNQKHLIQIQIRKKQKKLKRKNLLMIQKKQRQSILKKCNNFTMLKNYEEQR